MSVKQLFLATSVIALMAPLSASADTKTDPKAPVTREEFAEMLKETLEQKPELIIEAVKNYQNKQKAESSKEIEKAIEKFNGEIFGDSNYPSIGDAKNADVTIVEFFDYHCGYCKRMLPTMTELSKNDPKVRIIFRDFPILADDSGNAARASIAVGHLYPEKYFAFHTALMAAKGEFDDNALSTIAKKQGLDWAKIKKDMDSDATKEAIEKTRTLAEMLGVRGTPAMVIGKQLLPGALPYEDLKKVVDDVRAGKTATPSAKLESAHPAPQKPEN